MMEIFGRHLNVFRLAGDVSHLLAMIILLLKICRTRSCAGISGRSQILFAIVYLTRYLDLFQLFVSVYNEALKIIFIGLSLVTVFLIFIPFRSTYDRENDSFRVEFLIVPCVVLAYFINHNCTFIEVLWTFSIYLESVAILPQLFMISETGRAESITCHYLFALALYRFLYLCNWIVRYQVEGHYDLLAICAGIVQTILYWKFLHLYVTKVLRSKEFEYAYLTKQEEGSLDELQKTVYEEFQTIGDIESGKFTTPLAEKEVSDKKLSSNQDHLLRMLSPENV